MNPPLSAPDDRVPDADSADFHGAYCFVRNETLTIAVAEDLVDVFRSRAVT